MMTGQAYVSMLMKSGKIVEEYNGYTRCLLLDDGRILYQDCLPRRSTYVWVDGDNRVYYSGGIARAYDKVEGRPLPANYISEI